MHSIKHAPNDLARWADSINTNVESPERAHKKWVKGQGSKTNQGPAANLSMMTHTLCKEASALCCEAVQGTDSEDDHLNCLFCIFHIICILCIIDK